MGDAFAKKKTHTDTSNNWKLENNFSNNNPALHLTPKFIAKIKANPTWRAPLPFANSPEAGSLANSKFC